MILTITMGDLSDLKKTLMFMADEVIFVGPKCMHI